MKGIIKEWASPDFVSFSGTTRTSDGAIRLLLDTNGFVSGGTALSHTHTALALTTWFGFAAHETNTTLGSNTHTAVRYRLVSGGSDWWWNGVAWAAATTVAHWNDQATMWSNVASFTSTTVAVRVRLTTDDPKYTPLLWSVSIGVGLPSDYDIIDDLMRRGVLTLLAGVRATGRVRLGTVAAPVAWADIVAAFDWRYVSPIPTDAWDHSVDVYHRTSVFGSWNGTTLTLTSPAANAEVAFTYSATVAWATSHDYLVPGVRDIGRVPSIVIEDVKQRTVNRGPEPRGYLTNATTGETWVEGKKRTVELTLDLLVTAGSTYDMVGLSEATQAALNNRQITAPGCGFAFDVIVGGLDEAPSHLSGVRATSLNGRVLNVPIYESEVESSQTVTSLLWTPHERGPNMAMME
jgi:hypothetical protein